MSEIPDDPGPSEAEDEETPIQEEIKAAIHRIFELLGYDKPKVEVPAARRAKPRAIGLPEEVRRALADSLSRRPPVEIPMSELQGAGRSALPRGSRQDPQRGQREFLATLQQTIAALERIRQGLDPRGAEEVRKILGQLGMGAGSGEPVN